MTQEQVLEIFQETLWLVLKLGGPLLIISILVGLVIAILQAATQIHEQTLTFVPKLIAIALVLLLTAPWMMETLADFTDRIFSIISSL